jgi:hypothetical protein
MEDSASIKKTVKEEKEDRELAEKVNATLAEEEKERQEEEAKKKKQSQDQEKKEEDEKKKGGQEKVKKEEVKTGNENKKLEDQVDLEDQDEACPTNITCPVVDPCLPCEDCPVCSNQTCRPCPPCKPCQPCPVLNNTVETTPTVCQCPEGAGLSLPAAVAVGAVTGVLVTGTVAAIGLILRYVSPIVSGFIFVATIVIIWYLCSHYPETARELGGRAANLLREAAVAVSHRVMEAIRRHQEQVGFPVSSPILPKNEFHVHVRICTKIFYVVEN